MILLDNDVIHKLGYCNLLDDFLSLLKLDEIQIYVLETAEYVLKNKTKKAGQEACFDRIKSFLTIVKKYTNPDEKIIGELEKNIGIDAGEAILISALIVHKKSVFITGDKRCLKTLAESAFYKANASQLLEKAICFEQIILWLIEKFGFDQIYPKVHCAKEIDKALRSIFTSSATEESVKEGLNSYIKWLKAGTSDLLCLDFEHFANAVK
jgi:hypothetical protein